MGPVYQLKLAFGIALYLFSSAGALGAQKYCSLKVQVLSPDGERPAALVEVREQNGWKTEKEQAPGHDVEFCDLGILPVTVIVGLKDCAVTVSDVYLRWKRPYTLKVTYDQENCMDDRPKPPKPLCQVLLRVNSSNKKWISGATVKFDEPSLSPIQTDDAGRALFSLLKGDSVTGSIGAPGYGTTKFAIECHEARVQEKILTLLNE